MSLGKMTEAAYSLDFNPTGMKPLIHGEVLPGVGIPKYSNIIVVPLLHPVTLKLEKDEDY